MQIYCIYLFILNYLFDCLTASILKLADYTSLIFHLFHTCENDETHGVEYDPFF